MTQMLVRVGTLLLAVAILLIGHGLQLSLLPMRAEHLGWTTNAIGLTGSAYFTGFVVGCLVIPSIVAQVAHIRTFMVMAAMATIALLGAGQIGKRVIDLLVNNFHLSIIVWDPFLPGEKAEEMGVEKVETLEEAFERGLVVSNHLANLPETSGMIQGRHIASMRLNATFINTGRGATVQEEAMAEVLRERNDLTALLDVTYPEPPEPDSPLWALDNVHLTSHIAGSIGDEVLRMSDFMIEEFEAWRDGKPLRFAVTQKMLETMA